MCNAFLLIVAAVLLSLHASAAGAAQPVPAIDMVEASVFLEEYREASAAQTAEFYDLYSDRAVVHARVRDREEGIAFQGRTFKTWGRALLTARKTALDGSIFREPTVEQRGNRLIIRAKRYSTARCYWDTAYQVAIEREGPAYRIVDEHVTTDPRAHCGSAVSGVGSTPAAPYGEQPSRSATSATGQEGNSTGESGWHPLSEQELAEKSLRVAQEMAAARASLPGHGSATSAAGAAVAIPRVSSNEAVVADPGAPDTVWVMPKDRK